MRSKGGAVRPRSSLCLVGLAGDSISVLSNSSITLIACDIRIHSHQFYVRIYTQLPRSSLVFLYVLYYSAATIDNMTDSSVYRIVKVTDEFNRSLTVCWSTWQ